MLPTELLIAGLRQVRSGAPVRPEPPPVPASGLPMATAVWKAEVARREAEAEATRAIEEAAALERATTPGPEFDKQLKE